MPFSKLHSLITAATFLATFVSAGDQCYYLNGQAAGGVYRCDNTTSGESSCCNAGQICYSNGVCQAGPQNKATDWLRVGCTDKTWSSPACLKQCTSLVPESSAGIRPCGGILTSDQYCCDTQGKGPGSLACCSNSSNIFAIDPIASIIATVPLNPTKAISSLSNGGGSASSSSSSSNILIPLSTVSSTLTVTSAPSTATSYAISSIPSGSYNFTLSNSTATTSKASSSTITVATSAPASTSTKPTAATTTSSEATRFGSSSVGLSLGIAILGGLVYAL